MKTIDLKSKTGWVRLWIVSVLVISILAYRDPLHINKSLPEFLHLWGGNLGGALLTIVRLFLGSDYWSINIFIFSVVLMYVCLSVIGFHIASWILQGFFKENRTSKLSYKSVEFFLIFLSCLILTITFAYYLIEN